MKNAYSVLVAAIVYITSTMPAFAASTSKVYSSGALVLVFLGFCALVVVAQLIPAIITLWGMIKGMFEKKSAAAEEMK